MPVTENSWLSNEWLWRRAVVCVKRNRSSIMTHSGRHGSINQPQLVLWSLTGFFCSGLLIDTCPQSMDDLTHFCTLLPPTFFHKLDLPLTPERWEGWEGNLDSAAKPGFVSRHSKWEDEGVWRNAAVQTALWFSGHAAHCDSLWLKHRGDHVDAHPSAPEIFSSPWPHCVGERGGRGVIERKYYAYVGSICCNYTVCLYLRKKRNAKSRSVV